MNTDLLYYVLTTNPYQIESTELINELIDLLYDGTAQFISAGQIIELNLPTNYLDLLRGVLSRYEEKVPLYDIYSDQIYLILKDNVYPRIHFENYRFVDQNFYDNLLMLKNPSDTDKNNIRILSHYDMNLLNETFLRIFYKSFILNSYITNCRRPSFYSGMEHISPYYDINELYYLAYDWNLTNKPNLTEGEINHFCTKISSFDIPAEILLSHQMYIYDSKAIGLVKHYSLFGSYYMNIYLRKNKCCLNFIKGSDVKYNFEDIIQNTYLDNQINIMMRLIKNAPEFTKSHTVYRFVQKDDYLKHLKIGDIYQDTSFMSTTRNPLYYQKNYAFGYILIKIKLPENIKGIGLCIEAYSNFPTEEEIILPPTSNYRLDKITDTQETTQFHGVFDLKVQKKYEFTWVGNAWSNNNVNKKNSEIMINMPGAYIPPLKEIRLMDLFTDENIKYLSISDRLKYFRDEYVNINNQFSSVINNTTFVFNMESYDSSSVYKKFFYYEISDGIMITTSNPKYGNINILMELGSEIHINYYFRFSVNDPSSVVDLNNSNWIEWFSLFAYIIGYRTVVIHSNYILDYDTNDTIRQKQLKTRYPFSQNIYLYMKDKTKMFQFDSIVTNFDYGQLDYLFGLPINDVIQPTDHNELYRISQISNTTNMGDFYIYVVENFPKFIKTIEEKMDLIFGPDKNPFNNISYSLDAWWYLYNNQLLKQIPSEKDFTIKRGSFKKLIGDKKIPKFKNRLRTFLIDQ